MTTQLLSVSEAALKLGVKVPTIRKWIYQRRLPAVKLGRLTRLRLEDIERVAAKGLDVREQSQKAAS